MNEKKLSLNIIYVSSADAFRQNNLKYEIIKISGRKYFMLSSGWEL